MADKTDPHVEDDITKLLGKIHVPGVDWQALMASQQKNIAALTEANRRLFDGTQAVIKRQAEILQKSMAELGAASREMMKEDDPEAGAQKRFELAKNAFEAAVANMQELARLAGDSTGETLEIINKRASEGFEEIKAAINAKS